MIHPGFSWCRLSKCLSLWLLPSLPFFLCSDVANFHIGAPAASFAATYRPVSPQQPRVPARSATQRPEVVQGPSFSARLLQNWSAPSAPPRGEIPASRRLGLNCPAEACGVGPSSVLSRGCLDPVTGTLVLPSRAELYNDFPRSADHIYGTTETFEIVAFHLVKRRCLGPGMLGVLSCVSRAMRDLCQASLRVGKLDISALFRPRLEYARQLTIDPHRVAMMDELAWFYDLDFGLCVRALQGEYTAAHRRSYAPALFRLLRGLISEVDLAHIKRIFRGREQTRVPSAPPTPVVADLPRGHAESSQQGGETQPYHAL